MKKAENYQLKKLLRPCLKMNKKIIKLMTVKLKNTNFIKIKALCQEMIKILIK